jgi:hypothetical protein
MSHTTSPRAEMLRGVNMKPRESPLKELSQKLTLEDFPAGGRWNFRLPKGLLSKSKHNYVGGCPLIFPNMSSNTSPLHFLLSHSKIITPQGAILDIKVGWFKESPFSTQLILIGG